MEHDDGVAVAGEKTYKGGFFANLLRKMKDSRGLEVIGSIESTTILNKDSSNITMDDWQLITDCVVKNYDSFDAFIVTHGTDTMGYTTSAVSFALGNLGKPVIFTGSQVSYGQLGSDAVMNLENCLRLLVIEPDIAGVFLVFGTQIVSGTRVKKKTEFDYDSFKGVRRFTDIGTFGNTVDIKIPALTIHTSFLGTRSKSAKGLDVRNNFERDIVCLSMFPGLSSQIIIDLAKNGTKGFVLRAYGDGDTNITPEGGPGTLNDAFQYLMDNKIPLVITDQTPFGVASMTRYAPGVLARERFNAIPGRDLSVEAAVVKLSWLLANGHSYDEIRELMQQSLRGEISG